MCLKSKAIGILKDLFGMCGRLVKESFMKLIIINTVNFDFIYIVRNENVIDGRVNPKLEPKLETHSRAINNA